MPKIGHLCFPIAFFGHFQYTLTDQERIPHSPSGGDFHGKIYWYSGGTYSNNTIIPTLKEYDPVTNTWSIKKTGYSQYQSSFSVIGHGNGIYVAGGVDSMPRQMFKVMDLTSLTFTNLPNLTTSRVKPALVVDRSLGVIYIIGGAGSSGDKSNKYVVSSNTISNMTLTAFGSVGYLALLLDSNNLIVT